MDLTLHINPCTQLKVTHDNYTPGAYSWHVFPVLWIFFIYCFIWSHFYGNTYLFSVITIAVLKVCKCILIIVSLINDVVRFTMMKDTRNQWMRVSVDLLILLGLITQLPLITQATNHKCICISVLIRIHVRLISYFILGGNYTT